ncbi:MAG: hypothetical protein L0332_24585 [Chloroflexi bacterium]|nr:hypothetical protein [Chloroflexota bacterium]MCI0579883.1 hypothetical protein [Chloroflexota bacterium]MCI0646164.1 hypothetical protein [Chloroflexota bacterium]MCI0729874.1 hypothetical protein [Chloroflexota bacterium]
MHLRQTRRELPGQELVNQTGLSRLLPRALQASWLSVAILAVTLFVAGVPVRYEQLLQAATRYGRVLRDLDLSAGSYAAYLTALDVILILAHVAIATVIFWRA